MTELNYSDISSASFMRHYNDKLLLVNGNKVEFYDYNEKENALEEKNVETYSVSNLSPDEKIVYVSNNIKIKEKSEFDFTSSINVVNNYSSSNINRNLDIKDFKFPKETENKIINYVCIAFEQGDVWLCSQNENNRTFNYSKLIYRKICDIIKIQIYYEETKKTINCFILYRDYTLVYNNGKLQTSIKFPILPFTYNFCLCNSYQYVVLFNNTDLILYDICKYNELNLRNSTYDHTVATNDSNKNSNDYFVKVSNVFKLSKNYKYNLSCDFHPQNVCIALCGSQTPRYLTMHNKKIYDFSCLSIHSNIINETKFFSFSDEITLLITCSTIDYIMCVWDFDLEYCIYKLESKFLISYFDVSNIQNNLYISVLAGEKHLANVKLSDKEIMKKIQDQEEMPVDSPCSYSFSEKENISFDKRTECVGTLTNYKDGSAMKDKKRDSDYLEYDKKGINHIVKNENGLDMNVQISRKRKKVLDGEEEEKMEKKKKEQEQEDMARETSTVSTNGIRLGSEINKKNLFSESPQFLTYSNSEDKKEDAEQKEKEKKRKSINDVKPKINIIEKEEIYNKNSHESLKKNTNDLFKNNWNFKCDAEKSDVLSKKSELNSDLSISRDDYNENNYGFEEFVKNKLDQLDELQKKIEKAQKTLNQLTKVNMDEFIVLVPGLCVEPENINDQWCLFWNDVGHITKKKEGNKTYIYIFLFRGEETGKKKIVDVSNVTCASLWVNGFALGSNPYEHSPFKNNSVLFFHNLRDNIIWEKFLPNDEYIKGIANGNNFVAIVTSNNFLRIYSVYGYIINTILLKGIPVAICAYEHLLFIITCSFIYENVNHYNINNIYNCTLYKIYENFNNLKSNKYNTYNISVLHDGILSLPSCHYLVWVNMSNYGTPYIRDSSNFIYGLYPLFKNSTTNNSNFNGDISYDWVPIFNMNDLNHSEQKKHANYSLNKTERDFIKNESNEKTTISSSEHMKMEGDKKIEYEHTDRGIEEQENDSCNYFPLYFDNEQQISVIKLNKDEKEPCSNKIESCLGYNVEKKYIRMSECNLIKYEKFENLLKKNPNLNLDDSGKSEATLLSWEQYDEMRNRTDITCKQLFANIFYDYLNDGKNKLANEKLKNLNKLYDKWTMRMFTVLKKEKKKQKLTVKICGLFKNIKNVTSALRSVEDQHSTLYSELSEEYIKRQIIDETSKISEKKSSHNEKDAYEYKNEDQKKKDIFGKGYKANPHILEKEIGKNIFFPSTLASSAASRGNNNESFVNTLKKPSEISEKKDKRFLDKFFVGITKNENFDNLFSSDKKEEHNTKTESLLNKIDGNNNKENTLNPQKKGVEYLFQVVHD